MKNINIAEILKRCPKGMKLNCTMYEDVELDFIDENPETIYPINCLIKTNTGNNESVVFTDYGCSDTHPNAKCVIFPENKDTWEGFVPPCKFKVGDVVQDKDGYKVEITNNEIDDEYYGYLSKIANGIGTIDFKEQNDWELVPNKFDISTLVPFESKVLVRDGENDIWKPAIFGDYIGNDKNYPYITVGGCIYKYLIPYKNNKHLMGTTNECNKYYKTWKE